MHAGRVRHLTQFVTQVPVGRHWGRVLGMSIAASNPGPLLGRDAEIGLLVSLLDGIGTAAARSCCTASRASVSRGFFP